MSASPRNMLTSYRWISFTESVSGLSFEQQSWNGQLNWCCWAAVENTTCLSGKHHLSQWKTPLVSVENTTCLSGKHDLSLSLLPITHASSMFPMHSSRVKPIWGTIMAKQAVLLPSRRFLHEHMPWSREGIFRRPEWILPSSLQKYWNVQRSPILHQPSLHAIHDSKGSVVLES